MLCYKVFNLFLNGYIVAKNLLFCSDNCRATDCICGWWFQVQGGDTGPLRHSLLSWASPHTNTNAVSGIFKNLTHWCPVMSPGATHSFYENPVTLFLKCKLDEEHDTLTL